MRKPLLDRVKDPRDIKDLTLDELPQLCAELRQELIEALSTTGGHFASGLGAVELSVALHYVFDAPRDQLVWDTGHQGYPHKMLTGRKDLFPTLRQHQGLGGFLRRDESPYDVFGAGHAGTSVSAALGINEALHLAGEDSKVVAIIGDGSMTAGLAFEGLNQAGHLNRNLIVVLNDNEMSISPNVGALGSFLSRKLISRRALRVKSELKSLLKSIPGVGEDIYLGLKKAEEAAERKELAGDIKASWGDQMRSYVLNPYQMVKDLRTEHETGNPDKVFDGDIDDFIEAGIRWQIAQRKAEG